MSEIRRRQRPVPQLQVPVNEDAALERDAARLQQMAGGPVPGTPGQALFLSL